MSFNDNTIGNLLGLFFYFLGLNVRNLEKSGVTFNVLGQGPALKVNVSIISVYGTVFEGCVGVSFNYCSKLQNKDSYMKAQGLCKKIILK